MQRFPFVGGAMLAAAGLLATCLTGIARATGTWASDPLNGNGDAVSAIGFWIANGSAALKRAVPFGPETYTPSTTWGPAPTPDGAPGSVAPADAAGTVPGSGTSETITLPKTIGKVFFLDNQGKERWCSATSIQSAHRNVVATSGHCVYDPAAPGQVMAGWVFIPGYFDGKTPYGIYAGKQAWTHAAFDAAEDYDRDFAFVNVYGGLRVTGKTQVTAAEYESFTGVKWTTGDGRYYIATSENTGRLGDVVGGQGLAWNQPSEQVTLAFGYPAAPHPNGIKPYTGASPKYVYGRPANRAHLSANPAIDEHIGMLSNWTPGADGSPWMTRYDNTTRLGYVSGGVSLFVDQDRDGGFDLITSPYFDGETAAVYQQADAVPSGSVLGPNVS
ncbi:trypsin-like serine peptidase [Streptosporangium roseum]|uniref:trypsin-like serine peptidase n=1 Tax=Streptosporangium roseum TaxID=2001 RepID=UPI00331AE4C4